eukprot:TRINITY_DN325_c0_g1_i1.p1 TRINITY_DN325_c0_g1~~TRINITY_DN325_c0_g1_i1.p1  ORF type:complete len:277 (-),score=30.37 TRINITY_DN325_c0_g1_i1:83-913(-)
MCRIRSPWWRCFKPVCIMASVRKDNFRRLAPVKSVTPITVGEKPSLTSTTREGGRHADEFRQIFMRTNVVKSAPGSAYIEFAGTKVICAVYGPRQARKQQFHADGRLTCDYKVATFASSARGQHLHSSEEKELSGLMEEALTVAVRLEKYPKASIDVFALVLQDDGSAFAVAVTAASLALADAGIEMLDLVPCATASVLSGAIVLDPSSAEEAQQTGGVSVATMPSLNRVTQVMQQHAMQMNHSQEAIELCVDGCGVLYKTMQQALISAAAKRLQS